ncbi:MAG: aminopeptidase N [Gammaproteobacteria bacterium]|nr:aminopeptidase N [Gammaproteobacteria bacterium]
MDVNAMDAMPKTTYLKDYLPPEYLIETVDLSFTLDEAESTVVADLAVYKNPNSLQNTQTLFLNGKELTLVSVKLDGELLAVSAYDLFDESLTIKNMPDKCVLSITTTTKPQLNTALEGLYKSSGMYCTQCEAEGFRRITYYQDRPDVMSVFTTTINADKTKYPVLLSNGNNVESTDLENGRHCVKWFDPFPKPAYLFALVAGDLEMQQDKFVTCSGREVTLQIFVESANIDKCDHALASLQKSMKWDEEVYGREYDLDIFMIVAVNDFNMGAMENKGLNIFNSACVLAKPETATDADFENIEGIIGHEYFHNWSGNRVTCRDWFQLSLKEGFTVFRDQSFSADMSSQAVKRIDDVNVLRTAQFPQDAGPMAHPIRPDSFIDISNFYTVTIYNKGAEIVRMIHQLLGEKNFRKGTDLYFERHDGQAVTTEDFVKAMEDASGNDLTQFTNWYGQAGTPVLDISGNYDEKSQQYTLNIKQSCAATPGQSTKNPFHIPFKLGLLDQNGNDYPLVIDQKELNSSVLDVKKSEVSFTFNNISTLPVPSLLRGFSSPVKVNFSYSIDDLRFLMAHDNDDFNRWDAGQRLSNIIIQELVEDQKAMQPMGVFEGYVDAMGYVLNNTKADKSLTTQALSVPNEILLSETYEVVDPDAIHAAREFVCLTLAKALEPDLSRVYHENNTNQEYQFSSAEVGRRSLKNQCLSYLVRLNNEDTISLALNQYNNSDNMTDSLAALTCLTNTDCEERDFVLNDFYQKWKHDPLVVDKWFGIQARCTLPGSLRHIKDLVGHSAFDIKNPNKVRAVIGALGFGNPVVFHQADGEAYEFFADHIIKLNDLNPQMSARLANAFSIWGRYDEARKTLIKDQLQRILKHNGLAKDVFEIVKKTLGE